MAYAVLVLGAVLVDLVATLPLGALPLALQADGVPSWGVALVVGVGSATALLGSVPIGGLVDRFGRLPVIRVAAVLTLASLAALGAAHGMWANAAIAALRSLGITAFITAQFAYASALVREERAVSATATLGMVGNLSFALSPAISVWLWQHGVGRAQFGYGALLGVLGVAALWALPARHDVRIRRSRRILMRSAWLPTVVFLGAGTLMGGVNNSLAVLTFQSRGIANGALLFSAVAATTFALRFPAGRFVDRFGARAAIVPVALLQVAGGLLAARAAGQAEVLAAGVVLGIGWAAYVPVGLGLLFERSTAGTRGAAMGAYNLAFAGGMAAGAGIASLAAARPGLGFPAAAIAAGAAPLLAAPWVLAQTPGSAGRRRGTTPAWTTSRFRRASKRSCAKSTPSSTGPAR